MSDLHRSDGSRADAFLSWTSPRDASLGTVASQRSPHSNRRGRWLGVTALLCSFAIHLGLLFGLRMPLVRETVGAAGDQTPATSLQVRFLEIRLDAHSRMQTLTSTVSTTIPRHSAIVMTRAAPTMKVAGASSLSTPSDVIAIPAVREERVAAPRSDDWNIEPLDKRNTAADDYIQAMPQGNADVMKHGTGGVAYKATRFDSSWTADRQNAITQSIERATFHAAVKLPLGVQLDCAGGPSSPEPLRTTVPVLAIASTRCHGLPPPAPVAAKRVIDIQTLAPAQSLEAPRKPSISDASSDGFTGQTACAKASIAGEPRSPACTARATAPSGVGESGLLPEAMPASKSPEPLTH